ncbi:FAD/NAD(P)-binding protein [Nannocystaceae bacterium ST9]
MLDWLIIGGGIHGTHLARVLERAGNSLRILDPRPNLLDAWDRSTANVGMSHLRSPIAHDLDVGQLSLHHFADAQPDHRLGWFMGPWRCPDRGVFRRHAAWLCEQSGLEDRHLRAKVLGLDARHDRVLVETDRGELIARRVVLAIGRPTLALPTWLPPRSRATHPFDPEFTPTLADGQRAVIVGGGISAVQLALLWAARAPGRVTLVARRPPTIAELDANPRWFRPARVRGFARLPLAGRRALLRAERQRGSIPERVARRLRRALARGRLELRVAEVDHANERVDGRGHSVVLTEGEAFEVDRIVTATGFCEGARADALLESIAGRLGLARDPLGVPIIDESLRWHARLHVSGALAELALGPLAANIAGARLAAPRLVGLD